MPGPEPMDWDVVLVELASVESVPHSNQAFVASPFGVTLPFNVVPFVDIEVADSTLVTGVEPLDASPPPPPPPPPPHPMRRDTTSRWTIFFTETSP
jgi:hypothetical protein